MYTKRFAGYVGLSYPKRLEKAGLNTPELRRLHADLCLCYNILHGNLDIEINLFLKIDSSCKIRGHTWKIKISVPRLDSRKHYFSYRVIWNALSQKIVDYNSIASFKANLKSECLDNL